MRILINDARETWENYQQLFQSSGYEKKLAGRKEEKEEMQPVFDEDLNDHFPGIQVSSFEEFGEAYGHYIDKFSRLTV